MGNIREDAGLTDDKPVILVCGDSASLPTGVAQVIRGIFRPLHEKGEFQIVQLGWSHRQQQTVQVPWKIIQVRRDKNDPSSAEMADRHGEVSFTPLVDSLKPDLVFSVCDYDKATSIQKSAARSKFPWVAYWPIDSIPPLPAWFTAVRAPDISVFYTELARQWAASAGIEGPSIPHGIDPVYMKSVPSDVRRAMRERYFRINDQHVLLLTVGRNTVRKRFPVLIEAFAYLWHGAYARCKACQSVVTGTLVLPDKTFDMVDPGAACTRCGATKGMVMGKPWKNLRLNLHTDANENPHIPLESLIQMWDVVGPVMLNKSVRVSQGLGVPEGQVAELYQTADLYIQTASRGGWELPPLEAASAGLPVVAVDAPAHNEWLRQLPVVDMVPGDVLWEPESIGYGVQARSPDLVSGILSYLENPKRLNGKKNEEYCHKNYNWKDIADQWAAIFRQALDPSKRLPQWRLLQEV
jgi:glycosyltransferase involved in cell wall biosynthesis